MELGLIELAKERALAFGKTFEEFFNTGRYKEMGAYYSEDAELIGIKLPVYKGRKAIEDSSKSVSTQSPPFNWSSFATRTVEMIQYFGLHGWRQIKSMTNPNVTLLRFP